MVHPIGITVAKTVTLLLGGLITYMTAKAYRRTGAPSLRALAIGFGIITMGGVIAGVGDLAGIVDLRTSVLVQSVITAIGFGVITYSLYQE
ncbi:MULTISPECIES: DUF7521 family protein [Haloglomus]|jgi:hypothetical protein|uniref:DUF7521 family protein n=1 Tax=Haloglomus TaxID=2806252 RepID=UPI0020CA0EF4|nr:MULTISPECIES: hypothetical protein [Haloglomus]